MRKILEFLRRGFRPSCSATTAGPRNGSLDTGSRGTSSSHETTPRGPVGPDRSPPLLGDPPVGDGRLPIHTLTLVDRSGRAASEDEINAFFLELDLELMTNHLTERID